MAIFTKIRGKFFVNPFPVEKGRNFLVSFSLFAQRFPPCRGKRRDFPLSVPQSGGFCKSDLVLPGCRRAAARQKKERTAGLGPAKKRKRRRRGAKSPQNNIIPRPSSVTGGLLLMFVVQWTIPSLSTKSITKLLIQNCVSSERFPLSLRFSTNRFARF